MLLTHPKNNPKLAKSETKTWGLHLAPHKLSGKNVCPHASKECIAVCLNTAGRGRFNKTQQARLKRTKLFFENRDEFFNRLCNELLLVWKKEKGHKLFRPNLTSDIDYCRRFPEFVSFVNSMNFSLYDYTKDAKKAIRHITSNDPIERDYRLTLSYSGHNWENCENYLKLGGNVAVVFHKPPSEYRGYQCISGDDSDDRTGDPYGVIIALTAKGLARKSNSLFIGDADGS